MSVHPHPSGGESHVQHHHSARHDLPGRGRRETGAADAPSFAASGPADQPIAPPPLRTLAVTSASAHDGRLAVTLSCTADGTVTAIAAGSRLDRRRFRCSAGRSTARLRVPSVASGVTVVARSAGRAVRHIVAARARSSWLAAGYWATPQLRWLLRDRRRDRHRWVPLCRGCTYTLRFALYQHNRGYLTGWSAPQGPYSINQGPSQSLVTRSNLYSLPAGAWVAVRMEVFSRRLNRVIRDEWLPARAGTLAETNGGAYCRTFI